MLSCMYFEYPISISKGIDQLLKGELEQIRANVRKFAAESSWTFQERKMFKSYESLHL